MALTPGLSPNIRQDQPTGLAPVDGAAAPGVEVIIGPEGPPPGADELLRVEHEDGSITVSLDGKPVEQEMTPEEAKKWYRNLVDDIDDGELNRIADDLLRGIGDDLTSRQDWIDDRALGISLLGIKIEIPGVSNADSAPVEGMSRVRHPLLLEAVLRFQANARSEMLPTDGPVKIRDDDEAGVTTQSNEDAEALEKDFNHYLTAVDKKYYPDFDRMLLKLGFGGTAFRKVYFCPLRKRPVSETVDADDLIVSNDAVDLASATRYTHRIYMRPSTVKRMQILKIYRDVDLGTPKQPTLDSAQQAEADQQGIQKDTLKAEDRDREIYECYCELDISGFEHRFQGKITGLEIPYRVTIDVSSREVLSIVRNYPKPTGEEGDELPEARCDFVKYTFVPGLGFYDLGLLHILGNTTNAVTAAWREALDAGMFANFPGFLMSDAGGRQNSNIMRVPPGGAAMIKTGGAPIGQFVMPLPYKSPDAAFIGFVDNIVQTGQRVGGTSELPVGEGKQDAPVGTTLALIEQATKVLNAVHKRMHAAQAEEFSLLVRCFREHPESFVRSIKTPAAGTAWTVERLLQVLDDTDLVPFADPNTSSHTQRLLKIAGLKQLQQGNPTLYDGEAIDKAALKAMGWSNPEQFFVPPEKRQQMPPEMQEKLAELKVKQQDSDAKMLTAQAKAHEATAKAQAFAQGGGVEEGGDQGPNPAELHLKAADIALKGKQLAEQQERSKIDDINRDKDRAAKLAIERAKIIMDMHKSQSDKDHEIGLRHLDAAHQVMHDLHQNELRSDANSEGQGNG